MEGVSQMSRIKRQFFFCYMIKTLLNAIGLQEPEEQDVNTLLGEKPQPC